MKLVADIGSTNSRWLVADGATIRRLDREGFNPYTHPMESWPEILRSLEIDPATAIDAYLYGAGFMPNKFEAMTKDIKEIFPNTRELMLAEDLLGACHGMAGRDEGIVIIMGTGSNTCHYDGSKIIGNIHSLGFIMGDEGSANAIGKDIFRTFIRNKMPEELREAFKEKYPQHPQDIIAQIYAPKGNHCLGQFAKFAFDNIGHPYMKELVTNCIEKLFEILAEYKATGLPHYFTGSIAVNFEPVLKELCAKHGIGRYAIVPDYLDGLGAYHGVG